MRDGTLVKVIKFDDSLRKYVMLRSLTTYFNDFTEFCEAISEACDNYNLIVSISSGTDGGEGYYIDSTRFSFYDDYNKFVGSMEVSVIISAATCLNEFKRRLRNCAV